MEKVNAHSLAVYRVGDVTDTALLAGADVGHTGAVSCSAGDGCTCGRHYSCFQLLNGGRNWPPSAPSGADTRERKGLLITLSKALPYLFPFPSLFFQNTITSVAIGCNSENVMLFSRVYFVSGPNTTVMPALHMMRSKQSKCLGASACEALSGRVLVLGDP